MPSNSLHSKNVNDNIFPLHFATGFPTHIKKSLIRVNTFATLLKIISPADNKKVYVCVCTCSVVCLITQSYRNHHFVVSVCMHECVSGFVVLCDAIWCGGRCVVWGWIGLGLVATNVTGAIQARKACMSTLIHTGPSNQSTNHLANQLTV